MLAVVTILGLTGCTGAVSGMEYPKGSSTIFYEVLRNGVVTFMSEEKIKALQLDKADAVIVGTYKLVTEGNDAVSQ